MLINSFTVSFHQDKKKNASLDTNVENKTVVSSRGAKKLNQLKLSQHFVLISPTEYGFHTDGWERN